MALTPFSAFAFTPASMLLKRRLPSPHSRCRGAFWMKLCWSKARPQDATFAAAHVLTRLEATGDGWSVRLRERTRRFARKTVFLATGKHDLNAWERGGATQADLVGFKMHWRLAAGAIRDASRTRWSCFYFAAATAAWRWSRTERQSVPGRAAQYASRSYGGWDSLLRIHAE